MRFSLLSALVLLVAAPAHGSAMLKDFSYPAPVQHFQFTSQRQQLDMAYLDVLPKGTPNGQVVVLLHGKNFCAATWEATIAALTQVGYRVIAPDQIGFCKADKPQAYQFGLHQLAANTNALLHHVGVSRAVIMGHSMGGMLAVRYALQYPDETAAVVLVNPIGLEDWRAKGVPNTTIDSLFKEEKQTTAASIKAYQKATYYAGTWRPAYDRWVNMLAGMYAGSDGAKVAWDQALTSDMIFNQPVVHEFGNIRAPTLLLIGEKDNTAIGKNRAPAALKTKLGDYAALGPATRDAIPGSRLVTFADLGHAPQIQAPERFHKALLSGLAALKEQSAP